MEWSEGKTFSSVACIRSVDFVGHIAGIKDVVGFHGESVTELRAAFEEAVTDYLETCAKLGRAPQKPYSGNLSLRLAPRSIPQSP
jgi:predicted HicB family RNase H-like nuclease